MKTKKLLLTSLVVIPAIALFTSSTLDSSGKLINSGSPGEYTCSQANCHGAGNGQGSTGGLPDNGGPGSLIITSNPAFNGGNQYVPNTVYHMTIKVSEAGKSLFGFDFEALDNSGNTDPFTNNSVGTLTITDATHTRKGQPAHIVSGQPVFGRWNVTHQTNGGAFANSASFNFDWQAPASGTVNLYAAGNAANGDGLANAMDNVYSKTLQLSVFNGTGIANVNTDNILMDVFPNPAGDLITVRLHLVKEDNVNIQLFSLDGKLVKTFADKKAVPAMFIQSFSTEGLAKGIYILRTGTESFTKTQRIVIN
ncbi:MAG TPA: choice-of-anchor V domain-containing protein [Bacteroidia bacterium]|nr:choice-of-anchor V domain-containing protein [Bacteroidia bacterium]